MKVELKANHQRNIATVKELVDRDRSALDPRSGLTASWNEKKRQLDGILYSSYIQGI